QSLAPAGPADELLELSQRFRAVNLATRLGIDAALRAAPNGELSRLARDYWAAQVVVEVAAADAGPGLSPLFDELAARGEAVSTGAERAGVRVAFGPPVLDCARLADCLHPGEVLIDLFSTETGVVATAVRPNGTAETTFLLWPRDDRLEFVAGW